MTHEQSGTALQLYSTVTQEGMLEVSLADVPIPEPQADEVVVRVEAAPINPSDLGLLFGPADLSTVHVAGPADHPVVTARIPPRLMPAVVGRVDQPMPVGNEGAGVVVKAGTSPAAQALLGKTVALFGGAMYAEFRAINAAQCLVLPAGTTPAQGASCFVNPLTVLGMVGTMRLEGHTALVHTAAASNLGQMLNKVCLQENIGLVNIVRRPEHIDLLTALGARHVCNSSAATFLEDLTAALVDTGATLAFDAIGGGTLAGQILTCMEMAANKGTTGYSRYGSTIHKQVYIYGGLDRSPTEFNRTFGMAWSIGGWLLTAFLRKIGPEAAQQLRERVAAEITTTFASHYTRTVSLAEALQLDAIAVYSKQATGEKYLMNPNKGVE
jgi:NADPH2:quinone reductase